MGDYKNQITCENTMTMAMPDKKRMALTALILGIISTVAWIIPIIGLPVTIVGLVMGISARKSTRKWMAIFGIILCTIFLIAAVANSVAGAMMVLEKIRNS